MNYLSKARKILDERNIKYLITDKLYGHSLNYDCLKIIYVNSFILDRSIFEKLGYGIIYKKEVCHEYGRRE